MCGELTCSMKWGDTCGPSWVLRCPGRGSKTHVIVHVFILGTPGLTALLIGRLGVGPLPTESPVTVRRGYRRYGLPIPLSLPMWVCFWSLCRGVSVLLQNPSSSWGTGSCLSATRLGRRTLHRHARGSALNEPHLALLPSGWHNSCFGPCR